MGGSINITTSFTGGKELAAALDDLSTKMRQKIVRSALREAAQPILHAARSKAPVDTGFLVSQIQVRGGTKKGVPYVRVALGSGGLFTGQAFYGGFIEFGHMTGKRGGTDRHHVPAQPFMRPAFDENKETALSIFIDAIRKGLQKKYDKDERASNTQFNRVTKQLKPFAQKLGLSKKSTNKAIKALRPWLTRGHREAP